MLPPHRSPDRRRAEPPGGGGRGPLRGPHRHKEEREAAHRAAHQAADEAWRADYEAEAEANFCVTPEYAAVYCRAHAASATLDTVRRDLGTPDGDEYAGWPPSGESTAIAACENVFVSFGTTFGNAGWDEAQRARTAAWLGERRAQCGLLRDLFGEYLGPPGEEGRWLPFMRATAPQPDGCGEQWCLLPTPLDAALPSEWLLWEGGTIRRLARAIYEEGEFDRLPILADALVDAGCDDERLLAHLREPGPHVWGCWGLDRLLEID